MKLKLMGRAALLLCASVVVGLGLSSCATSTLGYLYVTSTQYGEVSSLRLDINSGAIKGVSCETHNGNQQNCNVSSNGAYPTKIVTAAGNSLMYVLNAAQNGSAGNVTVLTLGTSGSVYDTGLVYSAYGQNPIDMYINPAQTYLYVLTQYREATATGCAAPTPTTCQAAITVFSIGAKGYLNPVQCNTGQQTCIDLDEFVIGYESDPTTLIGPNGPVANPGYGGNHMFASSGFLYVLDQSSPGVWQIDNLLANTNGTLSSNGVGPTANAGFVSPSAIIGSSYLFVADSATGKVWTYLTGAGGSLTPSGNTFFCPASLAFNQASCTSNQLSTTNLPVVLDTMLADPSGKYLYIADLNNGTIFSFLYTGTGSFGVQPTSNGGATTLGTNVTCMTISSGTEFLYASGNGNVSGEQIDTSTGNLSTRDHTTTAASFAQLVPCVTFSPRT